MRKGSIAIRANNGQSNVRNPVKIDVSSKYSAVDTLGHQRCSMRTKHKDCYLAYTLAEMPGITSMAKKLESLSSSPGSAIFSFVATKPVGD
ncbi:RNA helicase [Trifolium repens]|nr:RNA helicase [Trifolium repens]